MQLVVFADMSKGPGMAEDEETQNIVVCVHALPDVVDGGDWRKEVEFDEDRHVVYGFRLQTTWDLAILLHGIFKRHHSGTGDRVRLDTSLDFPARHFELEESDVVHDLAIQLKLFSCPSGLEHHVESKPLPATDRVACSVTRILSGINVLDRRQSVVVERLRHSRGSTPSQPRLFALPREPLAVRVAVIWRHAPRDGISTCRHPTRTAANKDKSS
mmetsp:Transcript_81409/g.226748  ORF Transcript_81409/g.226748 Transcript_81409/m.226748 type:complete len:215 (-) Transcript_81409:249-893(-)